jgi:hypothetical protein
MADRYEFRVTGLLGPVVQSALPELTAESSARDSVLTGTAPTTAVVDELLCRLREVGLTPSHILIASDSRWHGLPDNPC